MKRVLNVENENDYLFGKVLLVGNSGVGKSSVLLRLTENDFLDNTIPTIGVDFAILYYRTTSDKTLVKMQMWDSAGQARFKSIVNSYFREADIVIYVYDTNDVKSFQDLRIWYKQAEDALIDKPHINVLLGNKTDLLNKVDPTEVIRFAKEIKAVINVQVSVKNPSESIESVMKKCVKYAYDKYMEGNVVLRKSLVYNQNIKLDQNTDCKTIKCCMLS